MPAYTYRCQSCTRTHEAVQAITAAALTQCLYCRGPLQRLIYPPLVLLQGGGWTPKGAA